MPTVDLVIKGKVQGVFFRATAKEVAEKTGVTGWVKNSSEGHVEVRATGSKEQLENFISWCKKGPSGAIVTDVKISQKDEEVFDRFRIAR